MLSRIRSPTLVHCLRVACTRRYSSLQCPEYDSEALETTIDNWKRDIMNKYTVELDTITASPYTSMCMTLNRPLSTRACPLLSPLSSVPNEVSSTSTVNDDVELLEPASGTPLPLNWHLAYFPARLRESQLASDGYEPQWQPPPPFERRVWASGKLKWWPNNPLCIGDRAQQETRCLSVDVKQGNLGTTIFVTTEQTTKNVHGPTVTDERCLAYMSTEVDPIPKPKLVASNRIPEFSHTFIPTPITLFRYSALTFNSHRIHFDHQYATVEEGYPAPLVHGPFTCTLLLGLLEEQLVQHAKKLRIDSFSYRAISPLYCGQPLTLNGRWITSSESDTDPSRLKCHLWANNEQGGLAMSGTATVDVLNE